MEPHTLGDLFPQMQEQVRKMRQHAIKIGPAGAFYVAVCDDLLRRADRAAATFDTVEMLRVYQEMKDLK